MGQGGGGEEEEEEEVKETECDAEADRIESDNVDLSTAGVSNMDINDADTNPVHVSVPRRITGPTRRSTKGGWTEEEDNMLTDAVQKFNGKSWKKIAKCIPGRTDVQCLHRWQKVLDPDLVKGPWKQEEDDLMRQLVERHGNKKWSEIAKQLPGRIGKQCRERWYNHLNPAINKTPWTEDEVRVLIRSHELYGNRWAEIAKLLPGRTDNSIKNHWNCSVKKRLESQEYPDSRKSQAGNQSLYTEMILERRTDTCSLDLTLGTANTEKNQLLTSDKIEHRRLRKAGLDSTRLPSVCDEITVSRCGDPSKNSPSPSEPKHDPLDLSLRSPPIDPSVYVQADKVKSEAEPKSVLELNHGCYNCTPRRSGSSLPSAAHKIGVSPDYGSPESILKKAARSFKHTPSIVRKRHTKSLNVSHGVRIHSPEYKENFNSSHSSRDLSPPENNDTKNSKSPFGNQLLSPPQKIQKLESSNDMKSVEKSLECAFNDEWDFATTSSKASSTDKSCGVGR